MAHAGAALDLFDLGVDHFAGNGAGDEDDRAFVARNHAAARGGPLDGQRGRARRDS